MDIETFKRDLSNPKFHKPSLFHFLKIENDLKTIEKIVRNTAGHPLTQKLVYGRPFPSVLSELKKGSSLFHHDDVLKEFEWHYISLLKYSNEISEFLNFKKTFDSLIIIGNFESAREILDSIEKNMGFSLWSIRHRLLLDEHQYGEKHNWNTRNSYHSEENSPYVVVYADHCSSIVEKEYSYLKYVDDYFRWEEYQGFRKGYAEVTRTYFRYKLIPYEVEDYNESEFINILRLEKTSSIFDRYLTFVKLAHIYIAKFNDLKDYTRLQFVIRNLAEKIPDKCLSKILIFFNPSEFELSDLDKSFLILLDYYTTANYSESYVKSKNLIDKGIYDFEIIELLVKSAILSNIDIYSDFPDDDTLLHSIIINTYHCIKKDDKIYNAFNKLYKIAHILSLTSIGSQICTFILKCENRGRQYNFYFTSELNSSILNPSIIDDFCLAKKELFINSYINKLPNNITLNVLKNIYTINSDDTNLLISDSFTVFNNALFNMRRLAEFDRYNETIDHINNKLLPLCSSGLFYEEIVYHLFYCYLSTSKFIECVQLYVNNYFKNQYNCIRLNAKILCEKIFNGKFKNFENKADLIELPILFKLAGSDNHYVFTALDEFLFANNLSFPSEIESCKNKFTPEKVIFFLSKVCHIDVLCYSISFDGSESIENERVKICQILSDLDPQNSNSYKDEISNIIQKQLIRNAVIYIDESKIYVNIDNLKISLLKFLKESFQRYLSILDYSKNNEYKVIEQIGWIKETQEAELDESLIIVNFKSNPCYALFREIFMEIRDNFISSNEYGLDAYLSTRIRHGTLENYIRSIFERLHIITKKDENGIYFPNTYWQDILFGIDKTDMLDIQDHLCKFSESIDESIRILREEHIQIKTEKRMTKPNALFDFSYDRYTLGTLYDKKFSNIFIFDDFINEIITELWLRTEENLKLIRDQISINLSDFFNDLIVSLQRSLQALPCTTRITELINSVVESSTEIRNALNEISQWFRISQKKSSTDFDFKTLFDSCLYITNNYYPEFTLTPVIKIDCDKIFKKDSFTHFVDIIRILLDNIIKHSLLDDSKLKSEILIWDSGNKLNFFFSNNFSESIDYSKLKILLEKVKSDWNGFLNAQFEIINREGGSGLRKICKILKFDLGRKCVSFDYTLAENNIEILIEFETDNLIVK